MATGPHKTASRKGYLLTSLMSIKLRHLGPNRRPSSNGRSLMMNLEISKWCPLILEALSERWTRLLMATKKFHTQPKLIKVINSKWPKMLRKVPSFHLQRCLMLIMTKLWFQWTTATKQRRKDATIWSKWKLNKWQAIIPTSLSNMARLPSSQEVVCQAVDNNVLWNRILSLKKS